MASSSPPSPLSAPLTALASLTIHCRASVLNPVYVEQPPTQQPLDLLHTIATLSKTRITRLSVALRPPVSVDGAKKCIAELGVTIVPPLVAAVSSCDPATHGVALATEVKAAVGALLGAITEYISGADGGGDRLMNTGVVWSAADRVIALKAKGLVGVVGEALKGYREMVDDAWAELKEWVEEEDEDGSDEDEDEQDFWDRPTRKARLDVTTKKSAEDALKKLKLVAILFGAARKRRLLGEGALKLDVARIDAIASVGNEISGLADELGMAFYEDEGEGDTARDNLARKAVELAQLCVLDDKGERDSYSDWFETCKSTLQKRA